MPRSRQRKRKREARAAQRDIPNLPSELWLIIFKYLSEDEREDLKFVCKSWYRAYELIAPTRDNVMKCLGMYQLTDLYKCLNRSQRSCLDLKFERVNFTGDSSFWDNNGVRIRSLNFDKCQFSDGILEKIIILCENLETLSFSSPDYSKFDKQPMANLAEKISERGMIRENLSSLQLDAGRSCYSTLSDRALYKLLSIFPKLKIFKIFTYLYIPVEYDSLNWKNNEVDSFELSNKFCTLLSILKYLRESVDRIETLELHFPSQKFPQDMLHYILDTLSSLTRLKKLSINLGSSTQHEDFEKFLCSKSLMSLVFISPSTDVTSFLPQLLDSNSGLKHLEISGNGFPYTFSSNHFSKKLLSSGLKSCKIHADWTCFWENDAKKSRSSCFRLANAHNTLPNMSLRASTAYTMICVRDDSEKMAFLLQCFRYLHHVQLDKITYGQFILLLNHQTNLKSLIAKNVERPYGDDYDSTDRLIYGTNLTRDVFRKITNIEHLELDEMGARLFIKSLSPTLYLVNLKYLKLDSCWFSESEDKMKQFASAVLKIADATPFLEGLFVRISGKLILDTRSLCDKLKRLRYLRCYLCRDYRSDDVSVSHVSNINQHFLLQGEPEADEHCRKLFEICLLLRVLLFTSLLRNYIYFFDTIKNTISFSNTCCNHTFAEPVIGGYKVEWLTY